MARLIATDSYTLAGRQADLGDEANMRVLVTGPSCGIGAVANPYLAAAGPDTGSYQVDFSNIESMLIDSAPDWTVRSAMEEFVNASVEANMTEADIGRYTRLATIEDEIGSGRLTSEPTCL
jgi:hypothetical protein